MRKIYRLLPDGTIAHLMYKIDKDLYIKVYKEEMSESMVILKGNVFDILGKKCNFYIFFKMNQIINYIDYIIISI